MVSVFGSAASRYAVAMAATTVSAGVIVRTLAASVIALSLFLAAPGYAQDVAQPTNPQRYSSLSLGKPLSAPRSLILKAACPSFSPCCCVIGGYSHCMTSIECAALGGGCTGRC
jgi:hypothetical protein